MAAAARMALERPWLAVLGQYGDGQREDGVRPALALPWCQLPRTGHASLAESLGVRRTGMTRPKISVFALGDDNRRRA